MKRLSIGIFAVSALLGSPVYAAEGDPTPEEIIRRFSEKEAEFRQIWQKYMYRQNITFEILAPGKAVLVRERRTMAMEVYFTNEGKRETRKVSDQGHLKSLGITDEDISDAISLQPFVLTPDELHKYNIEYQGKERIDELDLYVFQIDPKKIKKPNRYFRGKIWVDDQDFQIVMTRGKIEPDYKNNQFPEFETIREQIDGEYWFPTWTLADDFLFGKHLRQLITYENYKRYEVETSIKYGPIVDSVPDSKKPPKKPPKPPDGC